MAAAADRVAREDLVMFINACFACTGQRELYGDAAGQRVSIGFLHDYILGNYRLLYARSLAAGINDFARATAIVRLLATGKHAAGEHRAEEGRLIAAALTSLPTHRAYHVLGALREGRVNNRRARAVVRQFLAGRADLPFEAVKYRGALRAAAVHAHVPLPPQGELGGFLFRGHERRAFATPLFDAFRRAHFSEAAIYELPYTIAEGLAARRGVAREVFLRRIEPRLTAAERLRLQGASERTLGRRFELDPATAPLGRLTSYVVSLPLAERERRHAELSGALEVAAQKAVARTGARFGRVAAVLDNSYSASGSGEKRRRPLAVALATSFFLRAASREYKAFWSGKVEDELLVQARGATDLSTPVLDALESGAETVVIVSDGYENDPPGGTAEVLRLWDAHLRGGGAARPQGRTQDTRLRGGGAAGSHASTGEGGAFVVHVNPVFDAEGYAPRSLAPVIPTVGLRDAEDLPTMIAFARFACGDAPLAELELYLEGRARRFVERQARRQGRILAERSESGAAGAALLPGADELEGGVP